MGACLLGGPGLRYMGSGEELGCSRATGSTAGCRLLALLSCSPFKLLVLALQVEEAIEGYQRLQVAAAAVSRAGIRSKALHMERKALCFACHMQASTK